MSTILLWLSALASDPSPVIAMVFCVLLWAFFAWIILGSRFKQKPAVVVRFGKRKGEYTLPPTTLAEDWKRFEEKRHV